MHSLDSHEIASVSAGISGATITLIGAGSGFTVSSAVGWAKFCRQDYSDPITESIHGGISSGLWAVTALTGTLLGVMIGASIAGIMSSLDKLPDGW